MKLAFDILPILGVTTGVTLEEKGFVRILEVLRHFFPGINTVGAGSARIRDIAVKEIFRQYPILRIITPLPEDQKLHDDWISRVTSVLPSKIELEGPYVSGSLETETEKQKIYILSVKGFEHYNISVHGTLKQAKEEVERLEQLSFVWTEHNAHGSYWESNRSPATAKIFYIEEFEVQ
jgi:hypothetical protein